MKKETNTQSSELSVTADLTELVKVRSFVETVTQAHGFATSEAFQIALAVDEACSNLVRHAYRMTPGTKISVKIESSSKGVVISIFDAAASFDPLQVETPDMNAYFAEYRRGGLGVQIIKRVMDAIEYIPANGNRTLNELRLTKLLRA